MTKKKDSNINKSQKSSKSHKSHAKPARRGSRPSTILDLPPPLQLEQLNRAVGKLLSEKDFADADEMNRFLEEEVSNRPFDEILALMSQDPIEQAQDLAFRSMVALTSRAASELARQALELDPECLDAQTTLALTETASAAAAIERLREELSRAEELMGQEFIKETEGEFWHMIETRPYMRAREQLVLLLRTEDRLAEAAAEAETMLRLNPGDNQGIRYLLLGFYLESERVQSAEALLAQYPDEDSAFFRWGAVLARLLAGDAAAAETAFSDAMATNRYFFEFLTGRRPIPKSPPSSYSPGEPSEGAYCLLQLGPAWTKHPHALAWLDARRARKAA